MSQQCEMRPAHPRRTLLTHSTRGLTPVPAAAHASRRIMRSETWHTLLKPSSRRLTWRMAQTFAARFKSARVVKLPEGLGLVPLSEPLIAEVAGGEPTYWLLGDGRMTAPLERVLAEISFTGVVGYFEAEFSGNGSQAAVIWDRGKVVFGPAIEGEHGRRWRRLRRSPPREGTFNRALRRSAFTAGRMRWTNLKRSALTSGK
jgi:hypothetical protein